jgi:hypothetical protein
MMPAVHHALFVLQICLFCWDSIMTILATLHHIATDCPSPDICVYYHHHNHFVIVLVIVIVIVTVIIVIIVVVAVVSDNDHGDWYW